MAGCLTALSLPRDHVRLSIKIVHLSIRKIVRRIFHVS